MKTMNESQKGSNELIRTLDRSKRLLRFGVAVMIQGICFRIFDWGYSPIFFITSICIFLIAFFIRVPFWRSLSYKSLLWTLTAVVFGLRVLFVIQHLPEAKSVIMVSNALIGLTFFVELTASYAYEKAWDLNIWLKIWLGFIVFTMFIGFLFKIQHWPGADQALLFSLQSLSLIFLLMAKDPEWGLKKETA